MNLNVILSGHLTVSEAPAPGSPPPVTAADLKALGDLIVSIISDKIAAATAATDQAVARVQADVTSLNAKIDALQKEVDAGTATQADFDALDALKAKVDALDPTVAATLPTDGGTPTTPPGDGTTPATPPDQGTATPPTT